jgi:hypothetical protein
MSLLKLKERGLMVLLFFVFSSCDKILPPSGTGEEDICNYINSSYRMPTLTELRGAFSKMIKMGARGSKLLKKGSRLGGKTASSCWLDLRSFVSQQIS